MPDKCQVKGSDREKFKKMHLNFGNLRSLSQEQAEPKSLSQTKTLGCQFNLK
jgi:hypothetical protein